MTPRSITIYNIQKQTNGNKVHFSWAVFMFNSLSVILKPCFCKELVLKTF